VCLKNTSFDVHAIEHRMMERSSTGLWPARTASSPSRKSANVPDPKRAL
jgi:hypothetical protein